jgi:hypothetical protein
VIHEDKIIISRYIDEKYERYFSDEFVYSYMTLFRTLCEYEYTELQKYGVNFENLLVRYFQLPELNHNFTVIIISDENSRRIETEDYVSITKELKNKIEGLLHAYL